MFEDLEEIAQGGICVRRGEIRNGDFVQEVAEEGRLGEELDVEEAG